MITLPWYVISGVCIGCMTSGFLLGIGYVLYIYNKWSKKQEDAMESELNRTGSDIKTNWAFYWFLLVVSIGFPVCMYFLLR